MGNTSQKDVTQVYETYNAPPKQQFYRLLEDYLLIPWEEFSKTLIPNTNEHFYFESLQMINRDNFRFTDKEKQILSVFELLQTEQYKEISLRALFAELDSLNDSHMDNIEQIKVLLSKIAMDIFNISFNHKPPNLQFNKHQLNLEYSNQLNLQMFSNEYIQQQVIKNVNDISALNLDLISKEILERINLAENQEATDMLLSRIQNYQFVDLSCFVEFIAYGYKYTKKWTEKLFKHMTTEQMEQLANINQNFMEQKQYYGDLYIKKFKKNYKNINYQNGILRDINKYKQFLLNAYQWSQTIPIQFISLELQILTEILTFNIDQKQYELDLFMKFLENPPTLYEGAKQKFKLIYQKRNISNDQYWHNIHSFDSSKWYSSTQIVNQHLEFFLSQNQEIDKFRQFLSKKYLNRLLCQIQLKLNSDLTTTFSQDIVFQISQELTQQKFIRFCKSNKFVFLHNEDVKILVEMQNITSLTIKLFELNLENYYLDQMKEVDQSINLDGLYPLEEQQFIYKEQNMNVFIKEFTFNTITKTKQGVFIIELIGNSKKSRCIINKGSLMVLSKTTIEGNTFQILDEQLQICQGNRVGIWLQNQFYPATQNNSILIPYSQSDHQENVVLVVEKFAQLATIQLNKEDFLLECAYIVFGEQIITNNEATILIYPKVYCNSELVDLSQIENFKIELTITHESSVKSTKLFENLSISKNRPIKLQFQVINDLDSLEIQCLAKLFCSNKKLINSHQIKVNKQKNTFILSQFHLKYSALEGYELFLLGKNGEPQTKTEVKITLNLIQFKPIDEKFITDSEGRVKLGFLNGVKLISAQADSCNNSFSITEDNIYSMPQILNLMVNEEIQMPHCLKRSDFHLMEISDSQNREVIRSLTESIQFLKNHIVLKFNDPGLYQLVIRNTEKNSILINVVEGILWTQPIFIKTQYGLIEKSNVQKNMLVINQIEQTKQAEQFVIKGSFSDKDIEQDTQLFAIATSFVEPQLEQIKQQISQIVKQNQLQNEYQQFKSNVYLQGENLSDDLSYVINRKNLQTYVGNTLTKPSLLLQRQYQRDTQQDNDDELDLIKSSLQEQLQSKQPKKKVLREPAQISKNTHSVTLKDFLLKSAQLIDFITIDENGEFNFAVESNYSIVYLIAFNDNNYTIKTIPLENSQIKIKDIRYQSDLDPQKQYLIERNIQLLTDRDLLKAKSIYAYNIIDSTQSLFQLMKQLNYAYNNNQSLEIIDWSFILIWKSLNLNDKHYLYDNYQCDELNLFIYLKDPAYFETFIQEYLKNKLERSFVDCFILNDEVQLMEKGQVQFINYLNGLELSLLVIHLNERRQQKEQAIEILKHMKHRCQAKSQKEFEVIFDVAIQANLVNSDELIHKIDRKFIKQYKDQIAQKQQLNQNQNLIIRKGNIITFDKINQTSEFREQNELSKTNIIPINKFWIDLANHSIEKGYFNNNFFSEYFIFCQQNISQIISVLSFINIFDRQNSKQDNCLQQIKNQNEQIIAFSKELKVTNTNASEDFLIVQKFVNEYNEEVDEFFINKMYISQIRVVNCSEQQRDISILVEIPNGSLPVYSTFYRKQETTILQPYGFYTFSYYFYFPYIGEFTVYPASVSYNNQVIAQAKLKKLKVINEKETINPADLDEILCFGGKQDVLNYLETQNLYRPSFNINKILYLLSDKEFYYSAIDKLRKRNYMNYSVWSYSMFHNDHKGLKEFFSMPQAQYYLNQYFGYISCSFFEYPQTFEIFEYYPIVLQRNYKIELEQDYIINVEFGDKYKSFLQYLAPKKKQTLKDKLIFTYYLLLQNKLKEAYSMFNSISEKPVSDGQLQFDYFTAYFDFYFGGPEYKKAREISQKYLNYPSIHWRNLFYEIINQLSEYDQEENGQIELDNCQLQYNQQSESNFQSEQLETTIEGHNIVVTHANIEKLKIEFYQIDVETLFTQAPFMEVFNRNFSYIQPTFEMVSQLPLSSQMTKTEIPVPDNLRNHNLFISFKGKEKISSNRYFSTTLSVSFYQDQGYLTVNDSLGKLLPKVYIKVYCRSKNGKMVFYKDGYTDIRGKFDYASMNVCQMSEIQKFSLYVESMQLGCLITEIEPPSMLSQWNQNIKLISKNWNEKAAQVEGNLESQYESTKEQYKQKQRRIY